MNADISTWCNSLTAEPVLTVEYVLVEVNSHAMEVGPIGIEPVFPRNAASTAFGRIIRQIVTVHALLKRIAVVR